MIPPVAGIEVMIRMARKLITGFEKCGNRLGGAIAVLGALYGCAVQTNVVPAEYDHPEFAETVVIRSGTEGQTRYRVFLTDEKESLTSLRAKAEQRATDFCADKGKVVDPLEVTTYMPPVTADGLDRKYLVEHVAELVTVAATTLAPGLYGSGPDAQSVEIFFECSDAPDPATIGPPVMR